MPVTTAAPVETAQTYPLTPLQESMLFRHVLEPHRRADIEQAVFRLAPGIDADRLRAAWSTMTERHALLRTAFRRPDGTRAMHVIPAGTRPDFSIEEHAPLDPDGREKAIARRALAERERGFDLSAAPLQRAVLLRFGRAGAALIWTNHHAILDGRARALVLADLVTAYEGDVLPPAAAAFADHVLELQRYDRSAGEAFWRERLAGVEPTALPGELPRAVRAPSRAGFGVVTRTLDGAAAAALTACARTHGVTLTTLAQAAWSIVLARSAGAADVTFGVVRAGRGPGSAGERAVGPCITTLPLRVRVDESQPIDTFLRDVRRQWNALHEHEHTPPHLASAWSGLPAGTPAFESAVMVEHDRFPETVARIDARGALGISDAVMIGHAGIPLLFSLSGRHTIDVRIQFHTERFDADAMPVLIDRTIAALQALAAPAGARIRDVSLFAERERERVFAFNHTTKFPHEATVPTLFAACARRAPDAVALQLGDATMSYRELDAYSDRIAAHLRARGFGRGTFVGLSAERSFETIAALLGILKAGAASIALDPEHPPQRLAALLAEARAGLVLVSGSAAALDFQTATTLSIEQLCAEPCAIAVPAGACGPDDAAHVMYTSGSTGTPKGAVLPHSAVIRTVCGADYVNFDAGETLFAFAPLTFDVSILEIWGALLNGARLVICPPGLPSLDELAATIETQGVTTLWLTSALFEQIAATQIERLHGLRQLIVGGDVMKPAVAARVLEALPNTRFLNVYGPTEATVLVTAQRLALPLPDPIPIGKPIANARVYVLDADRNPVPIGMPGEIYTGGPGLALGYLNRPDLTAERFETDPFAGDGSLMYRSGDLARWRVDGSIDFLGRADRQLKIRGVRVEPAEVDAVLVRHPGVAQAATVARSINGTQQLVTFATPHLAGSVDAAALTAYAAAELPEVLRPAQIHMLERMPLTPTGKIDRGALPAVDDRNVARALGAAPEGALEIEIAAAMAGALGIPDVARDDDFFESGGDSLLAMRLVAQLRETFRTPLSMRAFAAAATPAALARAIVSSTRDSEPAGGIALRALREHGTKTPLFYVHGDLTGGGRYCRGLCAEIDAARPMYVLDASDAAGTALPSIKALAREAAAHIRAVRPHGPYVLGGFCAGGLLAYETAWLLERAGETVEHVLVLDGFAKNAGFKPLAAVRRFVRGCLERAGRTPQAARPPTWENWHADLVTRWERLTARYVPRSYRGRVTTLWSDETARGGEAAMRQWLSVAPNARAAYVPGTHLTTIAEHLPITARIFNQCLERPTTLPSRRTMS